MIAVSVCCAFCGLLLVWCVVLMWFYCVFVLNVCGFSVYVWMLFACLLGLFVWFCCYGFVVIVFKELFIIFSGTIR